MIFDYYEYTNQGGRDYNEDCVGSKTDGDCGLFVVCDGLGGHAHGELASACARDTLLAAWTPEIADEEEWLGKTIADANEKILAIQKEKNCVLKSTVVALLIEGRKACWAHVGDSRLYYIHRGRICAYTDDHSVAYKKYKAGEITRAQIGQDEDQSRLLRSLGSPERSEAEVHYCPEELESGDAFLLCSDGVWEFLREDEIVIDLCKSANAKQWSEWLRLRMMDRIDMRNDNLSLLTVMLG